MAVLPKLEPYKSMTYSARNSVKRLFFTASLDHKYCRMNPQSVEKFHVPALDAHGQSLIAGNTVRVIAVTSCASGLPHEDQARLQAIVGQTRRIVHFDNSGFVWLSFVAGELSDDFCLFPSEVALA